MKIVRVLGPSGSGKTTLIERLAERLCDQGRVGTVKHIDCEPNLDTEGKDTARHRAAGAERTYGISADGDWFATGDRAVLTDALDRLAVDCAYTLVEGFSDATLPTIVLDDAEADELLARGKTATDIDIDGVLESVAATDPYETLESLLEKAKQSPGTDRAGAVATFTGRVQVEDHPAEDPTTHPEFERYDAIARERMTAIREEFIEREGVVDVLLHHKKGVVEAGEDIVYVVVLAGHRDQAFRTVQDCIDRIKDEVPLFKKEVTISDNF